MKIPFLNIWVTRKDWQSIHLNLCDKHSEITRKYFDCVYDKIQLNQLLEKYKQPRNPDGTFKSKKKDLHDQLRAEVKQAKEIKIKDLLIENMGMMLDVKKEARQKNLDKEITSDVMEKQFKHNEEYRLYEQIKAQQNIGMCFSDWKAAKDHAKQQMLAKEIQAIVSNGSSCIGHYDDVRKASKI